MDIMVYAVDNFSSSVVLFSLFKMEISVIVN